MEVELTGHETAVGEPGSEKYFMGDPESIKKIPVLEHEEWSALVDRVAGPPTLAEFRTLDYAADKLREHFAFELWGASKHAWEKGGLAWPALILRLLSLLRQRLAHTRFRATGEALLRYASAHSGAAGGGRWCCDGSRSDRASVPKLETPGLLHRAANPSTPFWRRPRR
jgi:hypothetical protein